MSGPVLFARKCGRSMLAAFPLADGLFRRFLWSRVFFPEVEMRFIDSLDTGNLDIAVDVGAATGSYAWILNRKFRQVFCFEPGEKHSNHLERISFGTRIEVVKAAVGEREGTVKMYTPGWDSAALHSATLSSNNPVSRDANVREVPQVTLDAYLGARLAPGRVIDLIKVDVEGYELEVFQGAKSLIARFHPLIFCEIEQRHNEGYREIFRLLRGEGYTSFVFRGGRFQEFVGEEIAHLQTVEALKVRLDGSYDPRDNAYVNNFVFQHNMTRVKVT